MHHSLTGAHAAALAAAESGVSGLLLLDQTGIVAGDSGVVQATAECLLTPLRGALASAASVMALPGSKFARGHGRLRC